MTRKFGKGGGSGQILSHRGSGHPPAGRQGQPPAAAEKKYGKFIRLTGRQAEVVNFCLCAAGMVWILWQLLG